MDVKLLHQIRTVRSADRAGKLDSQTPDAHPSRPARSKHSAIRINCGDHREARWTCRCRQIWGPRQEQGAHRGIADDFGRLAAGPLRCKL